MTQRERESGGLGGGGGGGEERNGIGPHPLGNIGLGEHWAWGTSGLEDIGPGGHWAWGTLGLGDIGPEGHRYGPNKTMISLKVTELLSGLGRSLNGTCHLVVFPINYEQLMQTACDGHGAGFLCVHIIT